MRLVLTGLSRGHKPGDVVEVSKKAGEALIRDGHAVEAPKGSRSSDS